MKKILVIEDDPDILEIMRDVLSTEGYEVITYPDKNSIKGIIINRPDLVILDNKLRDGFGHELCREMKNNHFTRRIPVVLTSAYADLKQLSADCGADVFLSKPFDLSDLLALVKQYVNKGNYI